MNNSLNKCITQDDSLTVLADIPSLVNLLVLLSSLLPWLGLSSFLLLDDLLSYSLGDLSLLAEIGGSSGNRGFLLDIFSSSLLP